MVYVVIGASAAGINGVKELRKLDKNADIVLVSQDEHIYSRCILHHYMEGIRNIQQLDFTESDFIEQNNILWKKGIEVINIDTKNQTLKLSNGENVYFDRLLIASGSRSFFPNIDNIKAPNSIGLHNLEDCIKIIDLSKKAKNIVIMGGGLVGVDALVGVMKEDKNISIVETKEHILPLQLDRKSAKTYEDAFSKLGVKQYYNRGIKKISVDRDGNINSILLTEGENIDCDLLIVTAGVRANIEFLKNSDIKTDRFGLVIDEYGKTNCDNIFGAGDVTGRNPVWPAAVKEGIVAANNMAGKNLKMSNFFASKSTMNFLGIPTMSIGMNETEDSQYNVEISDDNRGNYKKIIHRDGKIYGAILQGDLSYAGVLTQLIAYNIDISKVKKPLFQIDYSDFFHMQDDFEFTY